MSAAWRLLLQLVIGWGLALGSGHDGLLGAVIRVCDIIKKIKRRRPLVGAAPPLALSTIQQRLARGQAASFSIDINICLLAGIKIKKEAKMVIANKNMSWGYVWRRGDGGENRLGENNNKQASPTNPSSLFIFCILFFSHT